MNCDCTHRDSEYDLLLSGNLDFVILELEKHGPISPKEIIFRCAGKATTPIESGDRDSVVRSNLQKIKELASHLGAVQKQPITQMKNTGHRVNVLACINLDAIRIDHNFTVVKTIVELDSHRVLAVDRERSRRSRHRDVVDEKLRI